MTDWIHEGLPPTNACAEVWLGGGIVRKIARNWLGDTHFTECIHPLQNAYCDTDMVLAWRPIEGEVPLYMQGVSGGSQGILESLGLC